MPSVIVPIDLMLSVTIKSIMLNVMLNVVMLNVVMLNVVMLNVVAPKKPQGINAKKTFFTSSLMVGRKELFTI